MSSIRFFKVAIDSESRQEKEIILTKASNVNLTLQLTISIAA
jgi:hypothetical protein